MAFGNLVAARRPAPGYVSKAILRRAGAVRPAARLMWVNGGAGGARLASAKSAIGGGAAMTTRADVHQICLKHLEAALTEAGAFGIPADVVGRAMLGQVVRHWLSERTVEDVRSELSFAMDNLDPDQDYSFMRP